ncbi:MAG: ergothioneine biosynthesis protein EgtB [Flavobacteriales bacterium]|nr:ergothioneine biosynthesis protein EgtB [Flavobacteriales bacterium]
MDITATAEERSVEIASLKTQFASVRERTVNICTPLLAEDYAVQPITDVSPPKWHLAHTTWFFETFVLKGFLTDYKEFDPTFAYHFNSYYNNAGDRVIRSNRGLMTRPRVEKIYEYREYVDECMVSFLGTHPDHKALEIIQLGIQHEMQHQELLYYDIKYILGHQPFFPVYDSNESSDKPTSSGTFDWIYQEEGVFQIGHSSDSFHFDNEKGCHKVILEAYSIASRPVTFGEYLEFMEDGGYEDFNLWHSDGWDYIKKQGITSPLYIHKISGRWMRYTLSGLVEVDPNDVLIHVSYYEAWAFAQWKGCRLPTEFEWEVLADKLDWGQVWEWTNSAYLPYPRFAKAPGALGEYNGKFMVNQMVLRGASTATTVGQSRKTYRNFFHPHLQWHFAGIRLAK